MIGLGLGYWGEAGCAGGSPPSFSPSHTPPSPAPPPSAFHGPLTHHKLASRSGKLCHGLLHVRGGHTARLHGIPARTPHAQRIHKNHSKKAQESEEGGARKGPRQGPTCRLALGARAQHGTCVGPPIPSSAGEGKPVGSGSRGRPHLCPLPCTHLVRPLGTQHHRDVLQRTRHHKAVVIVGVLPDKVHTPGRSNGVLHWDARPEGGGKNLGGLRHVVLNVVRHAWECARDQHPPPRAPWAVRHAHNTKVSE